MYIHDGGGMSIYHLYIYICLIYTKIVVFQHSFQMFIYPPPPAMVRGELWKVGPMELDQWVGPIFSAYWGPRLISNHAWGDVSI